MPRADGRRPIAMLPGVQRITSTLVMKQIVNDRSMPPLGARWRALVVPGCLRIGALEHRPKAIEVAA